MAIEGASFGRDCDTIARAAGCLTGALEGASAIRQDWIQTVERANRDFFEELEGDVRANFYSMAQRLVEALRAEQRAARQRAKTFKIRRGCWCRYHAVVGQPIVLKPKLVEFISVTE